MNASLFSVITVVRNDLAGLQETFRSVEQQTFRDFEWIVVDGVSTDGCVDFLKRLDKEACRWISEPDRGIYDAMNNGTKMANGSYIVFLNAGDVLSFPHTLQTIALQLEAAKYPDLLLGGANYRFPGGSKILRRPRIFPKGAYHSVPAVHQAIYFRKDVLPDPAYDLSYPVSADFCLMASLTKSVTNVTYLHEAVVDFETGGNCSQKTRAQMKEMWRGQQEILKLNLLFRSASLLRRCLSVYGSKLIHAICMRRRPSR
jgi:putative colanic acid biosynthesis glycosyltransferase